MLDLTEWRSSTADTIDKTPVKKKLYSLALVGGRMDIDQRSRWVGKYVGSLAEVVSDLAFNPEASTLKINNQIINIADIESFTNLSGRILLDATSLSFPELLYFFLLAKNTKKDFDIVYVEPHEYSRTEETKGHIKTTRFDLSIDGPGINLLPRFLSTTQNSNIAVSLGFEGHRFGALLQSDEFAGSKFMGMIGVPPFDAGWERLSYEANSDRIAQAMQERRATFEVAGANDPYANYSLLDRFYASHNDPLKPDPPGFHVAPFGTKPVAIAMAWFAVTHNNIGVLYDFVRKKDKRTYGCGRVHLWQFKHVTSN